MNVATVSFLLNFVLLKNNSRRLDLYLLFLEESEYIDCSSHLVYLPVKAFKKLAG